MASLCGVGVRMNNFFEKQHVSGPSTFGKDSLSITDEKCSRHADLFVHLFPRAIANEVPHPKFENFHTLRQIQA